VYLQDDNIIVLHKNSFPVIQTKTHCWGWIETDINKEQHRCVQIITDTNGRETKKRTSPLPVLRFSSLWHTVGSG